MIAPLYRLGDRLNPVLVKEVRQAVRGKFFRISFTFMLLLAGLAAVLVLASFDNTPRMAPISGPVFFGTLHMVFIVVAFLVVPQLAARSMASEREEKTYEALVISGLRPAQIIFGKWLSATAVFALFLCAFAPFLVVGFTLQGLDPLVGLCLLTMTLFFGGLMSVTALWTSAVARTRAAATMLSVLYALAAVFAGFMWIMFNWMVVTLEANIPAADFFSLTMVALISTPLVSGWIYAGSVASITHPEENASARLRIANMVIAIGCAVVVGLLFIEHRTEEILGIGAGMSILLVTLVNIPVVTENNRLGRRVLHHLSDRRYRLPLAKLFLPGGARGYLLYLIQLGIVLLPVLLWRSHYGAGTSISSIDSLGATLSALVISIGCMGVLPSIASHPRRSPGRRNLLRILTLFLPILLLIVAGLLELLTQGRGDFLEGGLNPFYLIARNASGLRNETSVGLGIWVICALIGGAMHIVALGQSNAQVRQYRRGLDQEHGKD